MLASILVRAYFYYTLKIIEVKDELYIYAAVLDCKFTLLLKIKTTLEH